MELSTNRVTLEQMVAMFRFVAEPGLMVLCD